MIKYNRCPICGSESIKLLYQGNVIGNSSKGYSDVIKNNSAIKKYVKRTYSVVVKYCLDCFHGFQSEVFSPEEELEFHRSYFADGGESWIFDYYSNVDILVKEIKIIRNITSFKNILDVGASQGEFCFLLKALHITPTAFDLCTKTNKYLSDNNIECFSSIGGINRKFDVIRVSHVLSHIQNDVGEFVRNLTDLLNIHGIIYFVDHKLNILDLSVIKSPLLHTNIFSEKSISLLIPDCLEEVQVQDFNEDYLLFKCYRRKCV